MRIEEFDKLTKEQRDRLFYEIRRQRPSDWREAEKIPYNSKAYWADRNQNYPYGLEAEIVGGESNEDKYKREIFRLRNGFDPGPVPKKKRNKQ